LPAQLKTSSEGSHEGYRRWINIKRAYGSWKGGNVRGMPELLQRCGLKLEGRHHSGIDDTRNIARCALHMLQQGWQP
jgi:inhibitor of KinA sporulation pathway (predicted exonuclease)